MNSCHKKKDKMVDSISVSQHIYGRTLAQIEFTRYLQKQNALTQAHNKSA